MNIVVTFTKVEELWRIEPLRRNYLDGLYRAQELLLEVLVPGAEYFVIEAKGDACGYFILHDREVLLEFHLTEKYWVFGEAIVGQILRRAPVKKALIKSFDHLFLWSALPFQKAVRSTGLLVRDYVPRSLPEIPAIRFTSRRAELDDLPRILEVDQRIFTDAQRLRDVIQNGHTWLFENQDTLIGFGIVRHVIDNRPDVDIGIAVDRPFRNKGYAVYIMRDMVERCRQAGLNPIAGCSDDNLASRRMGERVGLVSRFRLLELEFERPETAPHSND